MIDALLSDALGFFVVAAVLVFAFTFLVAIALQTRPRPGGAPCCIRCRGPLVPLRVAGGGYLGEAACSRCGALHQNVWWPPIPLAPVRPSRDEASPDEPRAGNEVTPP